VLARVRQVAWPLSTPVNILVVRVDTFVILRGPTAKNRVEQSATRAKRSHIACVGSVAERAGAAVC
jgi:hypothetical protein